MLLTYCPIRDEQEITKAINFFEKNNLHSLVSVVNMKEHPCECISIYNQNNDDWQFLIDPNKNTNDNLIRKLFL